MTEIKNGFIRKSVMSEGFGLLPSNILHDTDLTIEAKGLFSYLCAQEDDVTVKEICDDLNISERRYRKHRQLLINKGYLSVVNGKNRLFFRGETNE